MQGSISALHHLSLLPLRAVFFWCVRWLNYLSILFSGCGLLPMDETLQMRNLIVIVIRMKPPIFLVLFQEGMWLPRWAQRVALTHLSKGGCPSHPQLHLTLPLWSWKVFSLLNWKSKMCRWMTGSLWLGGPRSIQFSFQGKAQKISVTGEGKFWSFDLLLWKFQRQQKAFLSMCFVLIHPLFFCSRTHPVLLSSFF